MAKYTAEQIMAEVKEHNIRFVRMQFSDIFGILKNVSLPVSQLEKALNGEIMFDGSSVDGFARIEENIKLFNVSSLENLISILVGCILTSIKIGSASIFKTIIGYLLSGI